MALKAVFLLLASLLVITSAHPPAQEDEQYEVIPVEIPYAQDRVDQVAAADASTGGGSSSGSGGWGGWEAPVSHGWSAPSKGWGWPKFKYLKFTIPIPILPRIKFGIKGGLKLNAAIQHPKGWGSEKGGWRR